MVAAQAKTNKSAYEGAQVGPWANIDVRIIIFCLALGNLGIQTPTLFMIL